MGHALNKILKDVLNRYNLLQGKRVIYVPGWDCHGLPIELKAMQNNKDKDISPVQIRERAKAFAQATIAKQMQEFRRWGVMGDWDKYYCTMVPKFEAGQLTVFQKMLEQGYIYRGERPVYWSPSTQTALAEAELEYPEQHTSPSVYLLFPCAWRTEHVKLLSTHLPMYAMVWTTTPWTLLSNEAICYHGKVEYCLVKVHDQVLVIAKDLVAACMSKMQAPKWEIVHTCLGSDLFPHLQYHDAIAHAHDAVYNTTTTTTATTMIKYFYHGEHVTTQQGTGLVHTAPGHGMEDFLIGQEHALPITSPVDDRGCFTQQVRFAHLFAGLFTMKQGNQAVIDLLDKAKLLVKHEPYQHKYPYDWYVIIVI